MDFLFCGMRRIDHIAYAVPNLDQGCKDLAEKLGCQVVIGGRHLNNGTHNALINLGNEIYLELLAIDEENKEIQAPRWMGVDLISKPKVTRWAIKSDNLGSELAILKKYNEGLAQSFEGSRKKQDGTTLRWHMALPLPSPEIELAPFAVDWKDSIHPTKSLPNECELLSIEFKHPNPNVIKGLFLDLDLEHQVKQSDTEEIKLIIKSPKGIIELS